MTQNIRLYRLGITAMILCIMLHCEALRTFSPRLHSYGLMTCRQSVLRVNTKTSLSAPYVDLTHAVDKFPKLPSSTSVTKFSIQAKGPCPEGPEPFAMVEHELQSLSSYVQDLIQSENPVLTKAASHFFDQRQGKRFRPTIVSLMGRALASSSVETYLQSAAHEKHLQLGQITEMIHVASLIHDDVLDEADTRRGGAAVHMMYNNKVAVLAGDYLLARASVLLARLQLCAVVEVMASALDALVQGEIMQARTKKEDMLSMDYYLRKSYFKTASLICSSCKSAALLSGFEEQHRYAVAAEKFGYHLGMAYQIVDDILDFTGASASLGKPAQADLQLGLATAPILFASEQVGELRPLMERRLTQEGDVQQAVKWASQTDCVKRSYDLADFHAQSAKDALLELPASEARSALLRLLHVAISRDK